MILPLLLLLACKDKGDDTAAGASCCTGSDDPALWADSTWDLVPVQPLSAAFSSITAPRRVLRAAGNDAVYAVNGDGTEVRILTPSWAQPTGRWCVEGSGSADSCSGTLVTSGVVETTETSAFCMDDVDDKLLLVKPGGGRIELVGTNRAGRSWDTYNRAATFRTVEKEETDQLDVACAARGGRVALSSNAEVVLLDEDWAVQTRVPLAGGARALWWVGDSDWLIAHAGNDSVWAIDAVAGTAQEIVATGRATAVAVDPVREVAWIARTGGLLVRLPFTSTGAGTVETLGICGRISDLAVDHRSGAVHALGRCAATESGFELLVLDRDGLRATMPLDEEVLALVPPGAMGQLAALVRTEPGLDTGGAEVPAQTQVRAWFVADPADTRPPLSLFVVTTLEQPFTNASMACTREENAATNFQSYVDQLRANIPVLAETGLPVAVGVTWEFGTKARECGVDDVLDELAAAGFALGTMVHDKPCFSCTDQEVEGETPVTCTASDLDYATADDADACWPSDPDYCNRGDMDCWYDWVGAKALDVDEWIPGGSQFIFGADRHRLWDWEYISHGYRAFPRANGGTGYTISMFQGAWIYPDITDVEDPRAKDPAPWNPDLLGTTWYVADVDSFEQDSAFSGLLYMPGNSNALSRVADVELSDLSLVHATEEISPLTVTQEDVDTIFAQVLRSAAHRGDRPGTFYFHLADLTGYPLKPAEGDDRIDQQALLIALKARVEAEYGPDGLGVAQWQGPLEVRAAASR